MNSTDRNEVKYFVEGRCVVVQDGAELPARCVVTNVPTRSSKKMVKKRLLFIPWYLWTLIPAAIFLVWIGKFYGVMATVCGYYWALSLCRPVNIVHGICSNPRHKHFISRILCAATVPLAILIFVSGFVVESIELIVAGAFGFLLCLTLFFANEIRVSFMTSLWVWRYEQRKGKQKPEFWICGFHPDYISQLQQEAAEGEG